MMKMKKMTALLLVLLLALAAYGCGTGDNADDGSQVVARVGDREITTDKLNQFITLNAYIQGYDMSTITDDETITYLQAMYLEEAINLEVIGAYCDMMGYDVYPADYEDERSEFLESVYEYSGEWVEENGITEEFLIWYFDAQYYMDKVQEEIDEERDMDAEARAYYENYPDDFISDQLYLTASHILLETEEEALAVRQLLVDGGDFAELAAEHSIDPSAASGGGYLGTFYNGMMVEPFWEGAKALEVDEISMPVESEFGFHIIKVHERMDEGDVAPYDEMEESIKTILISEFYYDKLEELREIVVVEYVTADGTAVDSDGQPVDGGITGSDGEDDDSDDAPDTEE